MAPRGTGKTKAIATILIENHNAVAIVGLEAQRRSMIEQLKAFGASDNQAKQQVLHASSVLRGRYAGFIEDRDIYVDELDKNPYKGPFKAATTSTPFRVKVIK